MTPPEDCPQIGAAVEMLRSRPLAVASFEPAVVTRHLSDPKFGLVLEVEFGDHKRMQRLWPSSTIRPGR